MTLIEGKVKFCTDQGDQGLDFKVEMWGGSGRSVGIREQDSIGGL